MEEFGYYLDIMAISVDSFDPDINDKIGRRSGTRSSHLESLTRVRNRCSTYNVLFKLVNKYGFMETITNNIRYLMLRYVCLLQVSSNIVKLFLKSLNLFIELL